MSRADSHELSRDEAAQRRLEWLEEALRIAHESGALARARRKKHREQDRRFFGEGESDGSRSG